MPLTLADFAADPAQLPHPVSAGFDPERPWLTEDLPPIYATKVVRSIFIPMRDGTRLSTDFHIPLGATLQLPLVLVRTPYGKNFSRGALPQILPEQGIIYAVQDVHGRNESEGEFLAYTGQDREDGHDTVSWLAGRPWSNGSIGAMGSSYTGETAAKLAATMHPAHKCNIIMFDGAYAGGHSRNGAYLQGGVVMLRMLFDWFRNYVPKISYGPPAHIDREAWFQSDWASAYALQPVALAPVDMDAQLLTLPVDTMLDRCASPPSEFADMMRRSADPGDPYWAAQGYLTEADHFHTPSLHISGPLERGGSGPDNFRLFRSNGIDASTRDNQYLLFTPAPHSQYHMSSEHTLYGARDFGDTRLPYYRMIVDWFGHWLRGDAPTHRAWPPVRYFTVNSNRWQTAQDWPPEDAKPVSFFLASDGGANTRLGNGRLVPASPGTAASDGFRYDPANPTPDQPPATARDSLGGGYAYRSTIELRDDVLVYTSEPLSEALEVAGFVSVTLHVSSSAPDTDFAAVLVDVDPEGRALHVTHGQARMRYRAGQDRKLWMKPGEIYPVTIDLWHAAITFPAGHRIRLDIASSHFPFFDRNLNTGGDNYTDTHFDIADNRVHHGGIHASALVLPVRSAG